MTEEGLEMEKEMIAEVTVNFRVDQYDNVYDEDSIFFAKWDSLTDKEKETVRQNPMSAY